ncbi:hypothetical protein [Saccharopolyspora gloriosae]|uniref:hypothetical protein n=1 Tax=Saccharopolyspora gloriosae TaxID=455344 RepID=UPI001FB831DA|nr:hypothetical protein [Saccharopolyspora gloriosae]
MAGIRIETDELARHADALRAAGSTVGEAGRELGEAPADFGGWGAEAAEPYERLVGALRQRIFGTAHAVSDAGDELAGVVARHAADDEEHAAELGRGEDS